MTLKNGNFAIRYTIARAVKRKTWESEEIKTLVEMASKKHNIRSMSRTLERTYYSVKKKLRELNITLERAQTKRIDVDINLIKFLLNHGYSVLSICRYMNKGDHIIHKLIKENNLEIPTYRFKGKNTAQLVKEMEDLIKNSYEQ